MELTRRNFIAGAAALAGGAVGLGALAGRSSNEASSDAWDEEADVVVVGGGTGQLAALAAAQAGLSVILVEKREMVGGAMAFSGGCAWLANTEFSQAEGDSNEVAKEYLERLQMGMGNEEHIEGYLANTQGVVDAFKNAGINLQPIDRDGTYHQTWSGGAMLGRSCQVVEDSSAIDTSAGGGGRLGAALATAVPEAGATVLTKTAATRLVTQRDDPDAAPQVLGIVAEDSKGSEIRIKANKGVILATGGFEWNDDYVKNYLRVPVPRGAALSWPGNTGDGLTMAQSVGAKLNLMAHSYGMTCFTAHAEYAAAHDQMMSIAGNMIMGASGSIVVDKTARRFCREDADYVSKTNCFGGYLNRADEEYAANPAWWICDDTCYTENKGVTALTKEFGYPVPEDLSEDEYVFKAETLEELADLIGLDGAQLSKTVAEFNEMASNGTDTLFQRGELYWGGNEPKGLQALNTPPYYAVAMSAGLVGTIGGPLVNSNAQVIHISGDPIKGLYAMGNCAGVGAPGPSYGGEGGTIGPAFAFGIAAVNHIANGAGESDAQ